MGREPLTRRDLLRHGAMALGTMAGSAAYRAPALPARRRTPVAIALVRNGDVASAVEEALDLLGGAARIARGKRRVMLKPNLLAEDPRSTTKPEVVRALARLMQRAGKQVSIGEGSAAAMGFNLTGAGEVLWTRKRTTLDEMQRSVFEQLGYARLAGELEVPLVNLHSGEIVPVGVSGGLCYDRISLHRALVETDLLCSVPMMKTHSLAGVTLGMKNLMGLYPGTVYGTVRARVHDQASDRGSPGVAYETLDMVRANKLGLVVVDGSMAMEGNGPANGTLVPMNVIVAGTNALATDMVAAALMGYEPHEVPTFVCAHALGMTPFRVEDVEVRGATIESTRRPFVRPRMYSWHEIRHVWGSREAS